MSEERKSQTKQEQCTGKKFNIKCYEGCCQPEPELLDLDKVDKHLEICDKSEEYRDGYSDGIVFTERHHGMRGQHE